MNSGLSNLYHVVNTGIGQLNGIKGYSKKSSAERREVATSTLQHLTTEITDTELRKVAHLDDSLEEITQDIQENKIQLRQLSESLRFLSGSERDKVSLQVRQTENRLAFLKEVKRLRTLAKKYDALLKTSLQSQLSFQVFKSNKVLSAGPVTKTKVEFMARHEEPLQRYRLEVQFNKMKAGMPQLRETLAKQVKRLHPSWAESKVRSAVSKKLETLNYQTVYESRMKIKDADGSVRPAFTIALDHLDDESQSVVLELVVGPVPAEGMDEFYQLLWADFKEFLLDIGTGRKTQVLRTDGLEPDVYLALEHAFQGQFTESRLSKLQDLSLQCQVTTTLTASEAAETRDLQAFFSTLDIEDVTDESMIMGVCRQFLIQASGGHSHKGSTVLFKNTAEQFSLGPDIYDMMLDAIRTGYTSGMSYDAISAKRPRVLTISEDAEISSFQVKEPGRDPEWLTTGANKHGPVFSRNKQDAFLVEFRESTEAAQRMSSAFMRLIKGYKDTAMRDA
mgnify:CR=1 FL=1